MKIYGPYTRKDGRKHVVLYEFGVTRKTISYPKYLMEQHIGRKLKDHETIDHINRDFTDDRIENLQILTRSYHTQLDARHAKQIEIICVLCGTKVFKSPRDLRGNAKQGKAGPFCSKHCSGIYGAAIQNNRMERLPAQLPVVSEYYYSDK